MDAIVIACTTRDHVNLLNNEAALSEHKENRYALSHKLRRVEKVTYNGSEHPVFKEFLKPWETFTQDAQSALENIVVSFKQNLRVINKTVNYYQHFENGKKVMVKQEKGESWAIRKPMHKDTVFGEVNLCFKKEVSLNEVLKNPKAIVNKDFKKKVLELLGENRDAKYIKKYVEDNKDVWSDINLKKIEVYYFTKDTKERYFATRKPLDTSFNKKKIEESVTDTGIQKILLAHLEAKGGDAELAFSPDGIDEMNKNVFTLNGNRFHQPILKVRVYEKADKFAIGQTGNKGKKFVEAAKGTNLFFFVYENNDKKRSFVTIPLNLVIDCQKRFSKNWVSELDKILKETNEVAQDTHFLFSLSPGDLVYLPKNGETSVDDKTRIYKIVSFTNSRLYCIPYSVANSIVDKVEYTQLNKLEFDNINNVRISLKEVCVPIKVDRLGNIIEINNCTVD